jgi:hypothetical protein
MKKTKYAVGRLTPDNNNNNNNNNNHHHPFIFSTWLCAMLRTLYIPDFE